LPELKEFRDIVDQQPGRGVPLPPTEDELQKAMQALLHRQFIYSHEPRYRGVYKVLSEPSVQSFVRKYVAVLGLEFVDNSRAKMVGVRLPPGSIRFDWQATKLKKDETQVLLTLRIAFEEGYRNAQQGERGEVEITSDELLDKLVVVASSEFQQREVRFYQILDSFERKGICTVGDLDPQERTRVVTILPGIEYVTPEGAFIQRVEDKSIEVAATEEALARSAAQSVPENE
jgi:hypothetical protein